MSLINIKVEEKKKEGNKNKVNYEEEKIQIPPIISSVFIAHFLFSFFVTFLDYKNSIQTHKMNSPYGSLSSLNQLNLNQNVSYFI